MPQVSRKIRILFFIPGLSEGGAEKVLRNLVNHMNQDQFDITVHTMERYEPEKYLKQGIRYKAVNPCSSKLGKRLFSCWFRLCAEFKLAYRFFLRDNYDIEVAYLETAATKVIAQSTNKKAVKIAWVHCDLSRKEGIQEIADKVKKQYRNFHKIVCVSQGVRRGFEKLFGSQFDTVVLPNVIDEEEILAKSREAIPGRLGQDKVRLIALGRLSYQKNYSCLLQVCARLREAGYSFELNILGEGPQREKLEEEIASFGLNDLVFLRGFIGNPYAWLSRSDILVCSSRYEGLSTVVQEALILHKPVVTTPCAGMKELLGESEYGMIVPDSEEGLYQGLRRMITSPDLRDSYSRKAEERAGSLTKKRAVQTTQDFFIAALREEEALGRESWAR